MIGRAHHASNEGLAATIKDITIVTDASDSGVALNDLTCLLYTSPSPRDLSTSRMPSSA